MSRKPKLLFLASPFPPYPGVGAVRAWSIAHYLVRLEWDVTVVTPHPSVWRHTEGMEEADARIRNSGVGRILTDYAWRCLDPDKLTCRNRGIHWAVGGTLRQITRRLDIDPGIGWNKPAERACSNLLPDDVDVILATGAPFTSFVLAKRLSEKLGRPYVLDYRDPWTGNPHVTRLFRPSTIRREAALLAASAAVTIVSPSWGSALDQRFGLGSKINVISNGYDPEHLSRIEPHEFGHFAIVYAGTFYPPKRVISPLMAALGHLKARAPENPNWVFHYYGPHQGHIREEAARFGVSDRVVVHGNTSRAAALSAVRGAGLAVVISSVDENAQSGDEGIVPAKLFESIGLECPTLVIAPANSDIGAICERTGLALRFDGSQIEGIAAFIADAMRRKTPARREPEMYAWTNIVKKLDAVLRTVIDGNPSRSTSRADTSSGPVEVFTSTAPGSR